MIGDVLTSSILFEALRNHYPEAELHYLVQEHTKPVVANNPYIDKIILLRQKESILGLASKVRSQKYTFVIDVYSKINSALVTALSGAEKRISFHKKYTAAAFTHTFKPLSKVRTDAGLAIENRMLLLQGLAPDFPLHLKPKIYLTEQEKTTSRIFLETHGVQFDKPVIMVGMSGSSTAKTYPLKYMSTVLDYIVEMNKPQLLFNYLPQQKKEARLLYDLCSPDTQKQVFQQAIGKNLREFMAITSQCNAVIGNEGGAVNIAKALGIPTFSIFSPSIQKKVWSTYEDGQQHVSVHIRDYININDLYLFQRGLTNVFFYDKFKPSFFLRKLEVFLDNNVSHPKKAKA